MWTLFIVNVGQRVLTICCGDKLEGIRVLVDHSFDDISLAKCLVNGVFVLVFAFDVQRPELPAEFRYNTQSNYTRTKIGDKTIFANIFVFGAGRSVKN